MLMILKNMSPYPNIFKIMLSFKDISDMSINKDT